MTNDDKGGNGRNSLPPGLRQALEALFKKYIDPIVDRLDALALLLKSEDARDAAALYESLRKCNRELEHIKYAYADEQTNARTARENAEMWRERNDKKAAEIAELMLEVGFLKSRVANLEDELNKRSV